MTNELQCSHCGGSGAEPGYYEDTHVDQVECIEALRDDIRALRRELQALRDQLVLHQRERVDELPLAA